MLDIRGADGAPVDNLVQFLSLFVDNGSVLEYRNRIDGTVVRRPSIRRGPAETLPVVVVVDEKTGSGAEAFAGVLRARGRALVIGRRTAGKATIQSMLDLPSGSYLFIPVAELYEPGVGKISGRGVVPDLDIPATSAALDHPDASQAMTMGARLLGGTFEGPRRVARSRASDCGGDCWRVRLVVGEARGRPDGRTRPGRRGTRASTDLPDIVESHIGPQERPRMHRVIATLEAVATKASG